MRTPVQRCGRPICPFCWAPACALCRICWDGPSPGGRGGVARQGHSTEVAAELGLVGRAHQVEDGDGHYTGQVAQRLLPSAPPGLPEVGAGAWPRAPTASAQVHTQPALLHRLRPGGAGLVGLRGWWGCGAGGAAGLVGGSVQAGSGPCLAQAVGVQPRVSHLSPISGPWKQCLQVPIWGGW